MMSQPPDSPPLATAGLIESAMTGRRAFAGGGAAHAGRGSCTGATKPGRLRPATPTAHRQIHGALRAVPPEVALCVS